MRTVKVTATTLFIIIASLVGSSSHADEGEGHVPWVCGTHASVAALDELSVLQRQRRALLRRERNADLRIQDRKAALERIAAHSDDVACLRARLAVQLKATTLPRSKVLVALLLRADAQLAETQRRLTVADCLVRGGPKNSCVPPPSAADQNQ